MPSHGGTNYSGISDLVKCWGGRGKGVVVEGGGGGCGSRTLCAGKRICSDCLNSLHVSFCVNIFVTSCIITFPTQINMKIKGNRMCLNTLWGNTILTL